MTVPPHHRSPRPNRKDSLTRETGLLAEELVAQWLRQQGWEILQRRWHCRWGELDLVAHTDASGVADRDGSIAFVEVKARCRRNWDLDGRLAISPQKQNKLWKTAEMFLGAYPELAHLPCRFDVALVQIHSQPVLVQADGSDRPLRETLASITIELGQPIAVAACRLSLQHYIPSAFELLE